MAVNETNENKFQEALIKLNKFGVSNEEFLRTLKEGAPMIYDYIMSIKRGDNNVHIIDDEEENDEEEYDEEEYDEEEYDEDDCDK